MGTIPSPYLTRAELRELAGREQRAPIIEWLNARRWRYVLDADDWPKVARAYHDRRLGLTDAPASATEAEPDFTALRRLRSV